MTTYKKPLLMTIGDYHWRLQGDGRYVMHDGFAGSTYQCGVTESILVERLGAAQQEAARQWICVSDKLPDADVDVLVFGDDVQTIASIDADGDWFGCGLSFSSKKPTHWMPLPKNP